MAVSPLALPFHSRVEDKMPIAGVHRPGLAFGQDRVAGGIEHVIYGLPFDLGSRHFKHIRRYPLPVVAPWIVEKIPADLLLDSGRLIPPVKPLFEDRRIRPGAIDPGKAPIKAGLVRVVIRAVLRKLADAVGCDDRMEEGPVVQDGLLGKDRVGQVFTKHLYFGVFVFNA